MKDAYLKAYERYSPLAPLRFLWDGLRTSNKRRKLALVNRQKDYLALASDPRRLGLHRQLNGHLLQGVQNWPWYDYGEGYFYQSLPSIGVRGFRDTAGRVAHMALPSLLEGRRVLEIGCNTGFLSLSIAPVCASVTGFDIAPHLIDIAKASASHLDVANAFFSVSAFEDWPTVEPYEAVLSFANHSTYDGNTRQSIRDYFDRCHALTMPGGLFLFESHPPEHEGKALDEVCALLGERFAIESREILTYGSFLDRGRTYIRARRA